MGKEVLMAAPSKEYAYFVKGNKISLVEKDSSAYSGAEILNDDGSGTGTYQRAHGESNRTDYKSPLAAYLFLYDLSFVVCLYM